MYALQLGQVCTVRLQHPPQQQYGMKMQGHILEEQFLMMTHSLDIGIQSYKSRHIASAHKCVRPEIWNSTEVMTVARQLGHCVSVGAGPTFALWTMTVWVTGTNGNSVRVIAAFVINQKLVPCCTITCCCWLLYGGGIDILFSVFRTTIYANTTNRTATKTNDKLGASDIFSVGWSINFLWISITNNYR